MADDSNGVRNGDMSTTPFPREDVIRLLGRALVDLGLPTTAKSLEEESGVKLEADCVSKLREYVLGGRWLEAEQVFDQLIARSAADFEELKFAIYEQQALELLHEGKSKAALKVLQQHMTPLKCNTQRLHLLSSLLFCRASELPGRANWISGQRSREMLMQDIEVRLSTSLTIPSGRLQHLLDMAIDLQLRDCHYHNQQSVLSLLEDHCCSPDSLPNDAEVLKGHTDEVWHAEFSHQGERLVTASKDHTAIIWDVKSGEMLHVLQGHDRGINYVSWSPDDSRLLTCGNRGDNKVVLWNTATGNKILHFEHMEAVVACAWTSDGRFVTGSEDMTMCLWDQSARMLHTWEVRPTDLTISGNKLVVSCHSRRLHVYNLETKVEEGVAQEVACITSLDVSADGKYALVNLLSTEEIHLWDLDSMQLLKAYGGHRQSQYSLRACFGGFEEAFIVCGSEDNSVCLWHRQSGKLLAKMTGHQGMINAVCWNHKNPKMFATVSDDCTTRLWFWR